ncbi:MAG: DUF624 domain-containing protein [Clostridia bacterium]|nr:DUF624 domain-containing protein [Clostridia bacterium]
MFGRLMNQFYYGKSGKGDYRKEDLPQNRWQLFIEMLKIRLSGLVRLNLMYAIVWLPALAVGLGAVMNGYSAMLAVYELEAAEQAAALLALQEHLKALTLNTLLWMIPCIAVTGPCTAGIAYVTRNWARDEHAFIWSDFRDALKENWKQGLASSAITSLIPMILYVCWNFYGELAAGNALFLIPQMISCTLAVLWLCALLYIYPLMVTYRLRFKDLLRNGLLLTVGRLPMTAGLKLLSVLPAAIAVTVGFLTPYIQWTILVYAIYYLILGFSLSRFIGASYSNGAFDKYINAKIEGAEVDRGLYRPEEDEEEKEF